MGKQTRNKHDTNKKEKRSHHHNQKLSAYSKLEK